MSCGLFKDLLIPILKIYTLILKYNHACILKILYAIVITRNTLIYPDPYTTSTNYADHAQTKIIVDAYGIILVGAWKP
ncbi:hypothetical protein HanIR_Chr04g0188151 [Helianthus annuus]|nr:hypothetical protein HanIR_Chr04g0188151 [Helianthus annuus]